MDIYEEADLYCAAFDWPLDDEVEWLLALFPGARSVLEPFCGNARYGPVFADRGLTYVGFDLAEPMLARAPEGDRITVLKADARRFDIPEAVGSDLAWCPINSLCHLTAEADIFSHLECVKRHLAPDGAYVVEIDPCRHDGPWIDPSGTENTWSFPQSDGSEIHARWLREGCDLEARTVIDHASFWRKRDDRVVAEVSHRFTMRMWTCDDLVRITAEAGFDLDERVFLHKDFTPGPEVRLSPDLENTGLNYFFILRPKSDAEHAG